MMSENLQLMELSKKLEQAENSRIDLLKQKNHITIKLADLNFKIGSLKEDIETEEAVL